MARVHVKRAGDVVAVAETPAASGLVRVRRLEDLAEDRLAAYDALCSEVDAAVAARAGIHGDVAAIISVRCLASGAVDAAAVADANKGGAQLDGIVEYVANGSAFKVFVKKQPDDGGGGDVLSPCASLASSARCYALQRMRPLSISWAECSVAISCRKVDYDKSG
jgi:hypothetical protein